MNGKRHQFVEISSLRILRVVRGTGSALPSSNGTRKVERFRDHHFAWRVREIKGNMVPEHRSILIRWFRLSP